MNKYLLIFTGGIESTIALSFLKSQMARTTALTFDYGQTTRVEYARKIADYFDIPHVVLDVRSLGFRILGEDGMVVENRFTSELAIATGQLWGRKLNEIMISLNPTDPDFHSRSRIVERMSDLQRVKINVPYYNVPLFAMIRHGHDSQAPFEASYDCITGLSVQCGLCKGCMKRREAFALANILDPTKYAATNYTTGP